MRGVYNRYLALVIDIAILFQTYGDIFLYCCQEYRIIGESVWANQFVLYS